MKVADAMQKYVDFVGEDASVLEVTRLIFGRGINGVPVVKGKKLVGMLTERDILQQFFPSVQEVVEDFAHARDFEMMEEKIEEILQLPVSKIMSKDPIVVKVDTPLLRAQSLMQVREIGRLPVVDGRGNLVGIIAKGDIFRAVVGKKMPYTEDEEYHDWLSRHYDLAVSWESRLGAEIPVLTKLFKKMGINRVLDIGSGTGEHVIALAKNGFSVTGIENSNLMYKTAKDKWDDLPQELKNKVTFIKGSYTAVLKDVKENFGAAIFMGNMLAHIRETKEVLRELNRILLSKNAVIIAELINFTKAIKVNKRLVKFYIRPSRLSPDWEHAFFWFYNPPRKKGDLLSLNAAVLDFNGRIWSSRGMNSVLTTAFTKKMLKRIFGKIGFRKISFFGVKEWRSLLKSPFKPLESDWLIAVARR